MYALRRRFSLCSISMLQGARPHPAMRRINLEPLSIRQCGTPKKQKQQLKSKEALPSKEANSAFSISSVRRFAVPRKQSSEEYMQPLVLPIIAAAHCIGLADKDFAVLIVCHTGCDPPLHDHYFMSSVRRTDRSGSLTHPSFIYCLPAVCSKAAVC